MAACAEERSGYSDKYSSEEGAEGSGVGGVSSFSTGFCEGEEECKERRSWRESSDDSASLEVVVERKRVWRNAEEEEVVRGRRGPVDEVWRRRRCS
jgi:hypothetical protein